MFSRRRQDGGGFLIPEAKREVIVSGPLDQLIAEITSLELDNIGWTSPTTRKQLYCRRIDDKTQANLAIFGVSDKRSGAGRAKLVALQNPISLR